MRQELRQNELEAQKKPLVDTFYKEVNRAYGLRPEGRIDNNQFDIDADGKTLYWTPGNKMIPITATRGSFRFLALSSLARSYGEGGTNALRRSLGFTDYTSKLSRSAVKALQQADKALPSELESVEMKDLPGIADSVRRSVEDVETALSTITDPSIDTAWVTQAGRELAGLKMAMMGVRDELANNLAKLSGLHERKSQVERLLAMERWKLTEKDDPGILQEIRDRIRKIESELSDIEIEGQSRLEAISTLI